MEWVAEGEVVLCAASATKVDCGAMADTTQAQQPPTHQGVQATNDMWIGRSSEATRREGHKRHVDGAVLSGREGRRGIRGTWSIDA